MQDIKVLFLFFAEKVPCCGSWTNDGWYELGHEDIDKPTIGRYFHQKMKKKALKESA